jgi:hypothetical protein
VGIDVWFEADDRLTEQGLASALEAAGAVLVGRDAEAIEEEEWSGFFEESGLSFHTHSSRGDARIKAEDPQGADFKVRRRCVFRYRMSDYDLGVRNLKRFLDIVAATVGAFFVVSFQLESTLYLFNGGEIQDLG